MTLPAIYPPLYDACRLSLTVYLKLAHRFRARGAEHVPRTGGVLLVSNHASFLDPAVLGAALWHRRIHFLARDTLFENRLFRVWAHAVGAIPIRRNRADLHAMRQIIAVVQHGGVLCLFPEGTRTRDGALRPAKSGIGFLVDKCQVPVVPVYLDGTFRAFPAGARCIRPARITAAFGTPLAPAELQRCRSAPDARQALADLVMARIAALQPAARVSEVRDAQATL